MEKTERVERASSKEKTGRCERAVSAEETYQEERADAREETDVVERAGVMLDGGYRSSTVVGIRGREPEAR